MNDKRSLFDALLAPLTLPLLNFACSRAFALRDTLPSMESSLRLEVQEFVRACNNLAGSAHQNNGALTNEECEMVVASIQTLQKHVLPHQANDAHPLTTPLGAIPSVID